METVAGDSTVKNQLKENTYVDNIMGLVANKDQAVQFMREAIKIMEKGQFPLAKWGSNIQALNDDGEKSDTKLLGINWNKTRDTYAVDVSSEVLAEVTQRAMLKKLASIYNPLGLLSPTLVDGKHLYRLAVDERKGWDGEISEELKSKWIKWVCNLKVVEIPRTIAPYLEEVTILDLHHMMDASGKAVSAQSVAVVMHPSLAIRGASYFKVQNCKKRLSFAQARIGSMSDGSKFGCKCE